MLERESQSAIQNSSRTTYGPPFLCRRCRSLTNFRLSLQDSTSRSNLINLARRYVSFQLRKDVTLRRSYELRANPSQLVAKLRQLFPDAQYTTARNQLTAVGKYEVHDAIKRLLSGKKVTTRTVTESDKRYTLAVENQPLGGVLKAVAMQLNLTVRFDPRVAGKLNALISFNVKDATRDQLIEAIVQPAGLAFKIEDARLKVFPAGG